MQRDNEDLKKDILLIGASVKILNCQHKMKNMHFIESKTKLTKEHKQKLKAQMDLKLATGHLVIIKKQLAEAKLVANQLTI